MMNRAGFSKLMKGGKSMYGKKKPMKGKKKPMAKKKKSMKKKGY